MENETETTEKKEPRRMVRGPRTEKAATSAAGKLIIFTAMGFGAVLGANNTLAGTLVVLGAVLLWAVATGAASMRRAILEDTDEYERVTAERTGGVPQFCDDPNCVACRMRKAILGVGGALGGVVIAGEHSGTMDSKTRGLVH